MYSFFCFWALLLYAHFSWKMCVRADAHGHAFALMGYDLTAAMYALSCYTAEWSAAVMQAIGIRLRASADLLLTDTGFSVRVIWACTSVKQLYMFLFVMLFFDKTNLSKLFYIVGGGLLLFFFNLLRIGLIAEWSKANHAAFSIWHDSFQLAYYGLLFIIWLMWVELFSNKSE